MITLNGKLTTWTDEVPNLLQAAHDAAFGRHRNEVVELVSERHGISVTIKNGTAITESKELVDVALEHGYWIDTESLDGFGGWEILLSWSQDPNNPPCNSAIHKSRPSA